MVTAPILETVAAQVLLHGNAFVQILLDAEGEPAELFPLRPERVAVEADAAGWPVAYAYKAGEAKARLAARDGLGRHQRLRSAEADHSAGQQPARVRQVRGHAVAREPHGEDGHHRAGSLLPLRHRDAVLMDPTRRSPVRSLEEVLGRPAAADLSRGTPLQWAHIAGWNF